MILKEYIQHLLDIVDKNPEYNGFTVVSASDDEGNDFQPVHYTPSIGFYDEDEREFANDEEYSERFNAICIN